MNITLFKAAKKVSGILVWAVWIPRRASAQRPARAKTDAFKRTNSKIVLHILPADLVFSIYDFSVEVFLVSSSKLATYSSSSSDY